MPIAIVCVLVLLSICVVHLHHWSAALVKPVKDKKASVAAE